MSIPRVLGPAVLLCLVVFAPRTTAGTNSVAASAFVPTGSQTIDSLSFAPPVDYKTGASPVSVVLADLNEDGNLDLVVVDHGSDSVSVFLGRGDGTFGTREAFSTGGSTWGVAAADLNGDGHLDLAMTRDDVTSVSTLLGKGDGTFQPGTDAQVVAGTTSVAVGDMNGDTNPDLVVVSYAGVDVLLGDGTGGFQFPMQFPKNYTAGPLVLADLNGDGVLDAVTVNEGMPAVGSESVYLGSGGGVLGPSSKLSPLPIWAISIVAGDFNGDGRVDLAASSEGAGAVTVSLNNGDGTFHLTSQKVGTDAGHLAIGDLNRDGILDLVVPGRGDSSVAFVLTGNGDGSFAPAHAFPTGFAPYAAAVGDLNGDGRPDIVTANIGTNTVSVLINTTAVVDVEPGPRAKYPTLASGLPNPAIKATSISYSTPQAGHITLAIYSVSGRLVRRLVDASTPAGLHSSVWDLRTDAGEAVSAGVYLCELRTVNARLMSRIAVVH